MIASFTRGFIFIKTRKTGSTSAEIVLSAWCADPDIVTTIAGEDELLRRQYGGMARNFSSDPWILAEFQRQVDTGDAEAIHEFVRARDIVAMREAENPARTQPVFFNHMPATLVRNQIPDLWNSAYKITVERDPYERALSAAWWETRHRVGPVDISAEVDRLIETPLFLNYPIYTEAGRSIVDEITPYNRMWERFGELAAEFDVPPPKSLPRAKGKFRRDRTPAAEVLTKSQKQRIADVCAPEFEFLGMAP